MDAAGSVLTLTWISVFVARPATAEAAGALSVAVLLLGPGARAFSPEVLGDGVASVGAFPASGMRLCKISAMACLCSAWATGCGLPDALSELVMGAGVADGTGAGTEACWTAVAEKTDCAAADCAPPAFETGAWVLAAVSVCADGMFWAAVGVLEVVAGGADALEAVFVAAGNCDAPGPRRTGSGRFGNAFGAAVAEAWVGCGGVALGAVVALSGDPELFVSTLITGIGWAGGSRLSIAREAAVAATVAAA